MNSKQLQTELHAEFKRGQTELHAELKLGWCATFEAVAVIQDLLEESGHRDQSAACAISAHLTLVAADLLAIDAMFLYQQNDYIGDIPMLLTDALQHICKIHPQVEYLLELQRHPQIAPGQA